MFIESKELNSKELNIVLSQIKDRKRLHLGIAAALTVALITAFIPYIYGRLVDVAISPHSQVIKILGLIFLWLVLSLLAQFLDLWSNRNAYEISSDVNSGLVVDLFHHLINLPLRFHKDKKMGKVMRSIDRGLEDIGNFIEMTVFSFIPSIFMFVVALIILFLVEWRLSVILLAASLFYVIATVSYTKDIVKKQRVMHLRWEKAYGDLWDSVRSAQAVKASVAEEFERRRNIRNFSLAQTTYKNWRLVWQKMSAWQRTIFSLSFVAVFSVGVLMLRMGTLSPGKLIMFVGYTSLLTFPLSQLANQYRLARTTFLSFGRAIKYYDILPEKDAPGATEIKKLKGKVVFEDVSFGYRKDDTVLKSVSFGVAPGEVVALVGESGVGKTTLVELLGRYYFPTQGRILVDDVDIRKIKLKSFRSKMAVVPQEVLLFNDTIQNNIRYGRINATDEEVIAVAKAANANEFIERFPKKYEQLVGERGIKLSTGQKQRVAIARAILRDPKILILDEATSALDSVSERLVQGALRKLITGRTTFIIAHRLSTIQHADKIVVLKGGRVAEMGTHQELMKNPKGIYRNFWELQTAIQSIK